MLVLSRGVGKAGELAKAMGPPELGDWGDRKGTRGKGGEQAGLIRTWSESGTSRAR